MAGHTAVCCKLPTGIVLHDPMDHEKRVTLNGKTKAVILGADYGTTMVDTDFWESWKAFHSIKGKEFPALKSGAIFEVKSGDDAKAKAKDFKDRKTGFEGLVPQEHNVKPAEKE